MTGPLRVHLIHQGFADYVDGLLSGLDQLGSDDVEVSVTTIISGPASLTTLRGNHERHRVVALPRFRDPRSAMRAGRAVGKILQTPTDVVHWQAAGNPWVDLAFWRWIRSRRRHPAVVTVHDMQAHPDDRSVLPGTFPLIRQLARRADRLIVHAEHIRDQAIAIGADPARTSILPHGELATQYLPAERLPLPAATEPRILFFGRAQWYKGLDVAAQAMETVSRRVPDARLVVAGRGPSIDETFPPDRPAPSWCELHRGKVPTEDVPTLFAGAAAVVLPYREASQSGVAALAAGFGRPVVASRLPGLTDMVDEDVSGLLVEPGQVDALADALIRILTDPALVERLGRGAHERASTVLSWRSIADDLLGLYHEAVQVRGGGRAMHGGGTSNNEAGR
ncbi:MAG: glycosyltransferase family 4 protein [Actinomycetota bacterium]